MFPTFTGSSRRPRNVNLSGQKNANPFAANSWAPAAGGASKTVAEAQAERKQRQHERERLGAAQQIQRTWRGHRARRSLRAARRQTFDRLYQPATPPLDPSQRIPLAFPLMLSLFEPSHRDDYERLTYFARDLESVGFQPLTAGQLDDARLGRLVHMLITVLQRSDPATSPVVLVALLVHIIQLYPRSLLNSLGPYFRLLAKYCSVRDADKQATDLLQKAIQAPLVPGNADESYISQAYQEFATSFLTQPLYLLEENMASFAGNVDMGVLSTTILRLGTRNEHKRLSQDGALWLLSHFIALQKAQPHLVRRSIELEALHTQLSKLSADIRSRLASRPLNQSEGGGETSTNLPQRSPIPPYIARQLRSLVGRQEISQLLSKFTANYSAGHATQLKDTSWLAGYILTLIRCFPDQGDEIRMRLYLADINCAGSRIPAVKFFFTAVVSTSVFNQILGAPQQTLELLQQRNRSRASSAQPRDESQWDSEWRTVLLFLELYTFVLRLTDDDDFFAGLGALQNLDVTSSRVRLCMLRLDELKNLSLFLKYLAFRLHYNSAELLRDSGRDSSSFHLQAVTATAIAGSSDREKAPTQRVGTYNVIPGLDFGAFKALVTSAVRMLYERDSRRTFLPKDHWLMTSNFDMDGFLSAVVLEEQRQHELRERGTDSGEGEDDDDSGEGEDPDHVYHPALTWGGQRRSRYAMVEKLQAQRRKAQRERLRDVVGPKLEILQNMPYVIPFETRVQIFRQFVSLDKQRRRDGHIDPDQWRMHVINQHGDPWDGNGPGRGIIGRHHAKIRRGKVFQDAFEKFYELGEGLKEPIQITFVDKFDTVEAGIDGGGVTKEFLTSVTKEAFIEEGRLFVANRHNAHYPNPFAFDQTQKGLRDAAIAEGSPDWENTLAELLEQYEFLGRIVGKCLYEGILIDIAFAGFFLLKWASSAKDAGYRANINDLREMDEDLYQGMISLKNFKGDVAGLDLDFTINDQVSLPGEPVVTKTRNLIPDGDKTLVTNENRPLYISYVARHRLVIQPYRQTQAFLRGLGSIIDPSWLSMFNQSELQRLVGGDPAEIDVDDLRRNTDYSGVYQIGDDGEEHATVKLFWSVMRSLRDSERRDVLKFVTSTPRAPLLGFSQLNPRFTIRDGGGDQERLPSASTCVNLLKLPRYTDAATLRTKLLYAVTSNAGFDLS